MLVLGRDARPGEETSRSDVNMLVRVDPETATVSLVSIPRDTMVTINEARRRSTPSMPSLARAVPCAACPSLPACPFRTS